MADANESPCDISDDEDKNVALAQKIFSYRPSANTNLLPKGGLKYNDYRGAEEEFQRLQDFYKARNSALASLKVRKLANLGLAEWISELCVAKIVEQGKFMQSFGFAHENGFHALYPEEALYLLDVGDIELQYKEVLLSLQDAYMLLLTSERGGALCTFDEYAVYAHLRRMGYKVQRYFVPDYESAPSSDDESEKMSSKRECDGLEISILVEAKKIKVDSDCKDIVDKSFEIAQSNNSKDTPEDIKESGRGWWFSDEVKSAVSASSKSISPSLKVDIPNFAVSNSDSLVLQEVEQSLIPENTCSWSWKIEEIWFERLKRDLDENPRREYSFPKHLDYSKINTEATSWPHFKTLLQQAIEERKSALDSLCDKMHGGNLKPLIHPDNTTNIKSVFEQLNVFQERPNATADLQSDINTFKIRFNVFNPDSDKPFRKTRPGKPLIRICVLTPSDPLPDYADISELKARGGDVPVKIALVDTGKVLILGFDDIDIPVDLLTFR